MVHSTSISPSSRPTRCCNRGSTSQSLLLIAVLLVLVHIFLPSLHFFLPGLSVSALASLITQRRLATHASTRLARSLGSIGRRVGRNQRRRSSADFECHLR